MKFQYIEEYVEFIGGLIDTNGKKIGWWPTPVLQLANYDVNFVTSVAEQVSQNKGLSDRQAALVERLILKYERQLAKRGVEQPDHRNYRTPLREVDRSSSLTLREDNMLYLKFPFDNNKILTIKEFMKNSQGRVAWSKDDKAWTFGLTEYNVSWLVTFCKSHNIQVDEPVLGLFDAILEIEQTPFKIELQYVDGKLHIENAPDSMNDYIATSVGFKNIYALVDMAGALGYTVSEEIAQIMTAEHGAPFMELCAGKDIDFVPKDRKLEDIIEWAITVDRLPICVYNPNFLVPDLTPFQKYFSDDEIEQISLKDPIDDVLVDSRTKVVYTNKILSTWQGRMPLLITYANLMHGATKRGFLDQAEKVVYYCEQLPKR